MLCTEVYLRCGTPDKNQNIGNHERNFDYNDHIILNDIHFIYMKLPAGFHNSVIKYYNRKL